MVLPVCVVAPYQPLIMDHLPTFNRPVPLDLPGVVYEASFEV